MEHSFAVRLDASKRCERTPRAAVRKAAALHSTAVSAVCEYASLPLHCRSAARCVCVHTRLCPPAAIVRRTPIAEPVERCYIVARCASHVARPDTAGCMTSRWSTLSLRSSAAVTPSTCERQPVAICICRHPAAADRFRPLSVTRVWIARAQVRLSAHVSVRACVRA